MARALLVGCGCRGRELGAALLSEGWAVRGTSRTAAGVAAIAATGIEALHADPDQLASVTEQLADVTVLAWLMGSATSQSAASVVNGPRLESLLERLVDTPVRGFVLEGRGSVARDVLDRAAAMVEAAEARWRIPVRILRADPGFPREWRTAARNAVHSLIA